MVIVSDTTDLSEVITPEIITGYQYGVGNVFIGVYPFPRNLDQIIIHLPPNTVLESPPYISEGQQAVWDGTAWILQDIPVISSSAEDL